MTERKSLAGASPTLHHVLVNELDNVRNRLYVLTRKDGAWRREELPAALKRAAAIAGESAPPRIVPSVKLSDAPL